VPVYTVSQLTRYLKHLLEHDRLLVDLWVSGEVSNLSQSGAGHRYFTLRDSDGQIRCVMFRYGVGGHMLSDGGAVVVHGRASLYEVRGELQLYVDLVQTEGVGELYLELEQLKVKLQREGLFEDTRKRPLPTYPRRVAVITSPSGSVWHDIKTVVSRRYPLVELILVPCRVQGEDAADTIWNAFRAVGDIQGLDVVVLARGGGSLEELAPFNQERVARAIYACPTVVICAVGHETDFTVADLVADVRAPTPSAAAAMLVPDQRELRTWLFEYRRALEAAVAKAMEDQVTDLNRLVDRIQSHIPDIATRRQRVDDFVKTISLCLRGEMALTRERLQGFYSRLGALDPRAVLRRGYAVVQQSATGAVVRSISQVAIGDVISIDVEDGGFPAEVLVVGEVSSAVP
jgi:exodeoxyribonuclease VII large subunit